MFLATGPKELYSLDPSVSSDGIEECQEIDNQSCAKINVDFEVLKSESDIWLEGAQEAWKEKVLALCFEDF